MTDALVYVSSYLGQPIEYCLDHTVEWLNLMSDAIMRKEFEKQVFEMKIHGVAEKEIEKIRRRFNAVLGKTEKQKDIRIPIENLQRQGFMIGRPNKTRVIR